MYMDLYYQDFITFLFQKIKSKMFEKLKNKGLSGTQTIFKNFQKKGILYLRSYVVENVIDVEVHLNLITCR